KDIRDFIKVGEEIKAKIINFDPKVKRIGLSLKALQEAPAKTEAKEEKTEEVKEEKKKAPAKKKEEKTEEK
ncbi:MAG: hypothetical protein U9Q66_03925, partial [Patescibacteria group bacterium]|nr:hypothetical protein [Patescibacteria group bacterium]